jgi:hypothetical protein
VRTNDAYCVQCISSTTNDWDPRSIISRAAPAGNVSLIFATSPEPSTARMSGPRARHPSAGIPPPPSWQPTLALDDPLGVPPQVDDHADAELLQGVDVGIRCLCEVPAPVETPGAHESSVVGEMATCARKLAICSNAMSLMSRLGLRQPIVERRAPVGRPVHGARQWCHHVGVAAGDVLRRPALPDHEPVVNLAFVAQTAWCHGSGATGPAPGCPLPTPSPPRADWRAPRTSRWARARTHA